MNITLQGTHVELSDELRAFVDEKMEDCLKALGDVNTDPVHVDIQLELMTTRHPQEREDEQQYRAEANVSIAGRLIRAEESAMNLKQAIVKMKHTLTRELRHWRERLIEGHREGARTMKEILSDAEAEPPSKTEIWADEWSEEEEKIRERARKENDEKWAEWEEGGEDERDFI